MICNNFTDQWYRVILSQYLNNFYTEFLPITDTQLVSILVNEEKIFLNMARDSPEPPGVIQFICWISRKYIHSYRRVPAFIGAFKLLYTLLLKKIHLIKSSQSAIRGDWKL